MSVEMILSVVTLCLSSDLGLGDCVNGAYYKKLHYDKRLEGCAVERCDVGSLLECGMKCNRLLQATCKSFNYIKDITGDICELNNCAAAEAEQTTRLVHQPNTQYYEVISTTTPLQPTPRPDVPPYMSGDWMLIARFSNADEKHWMDDQGGWWYDKLVSYGRTDDPADNNDMIAPGFWSKSAREFKITKSNDDFHQALLITKNNCLKGGTFRAKVTKMGRFRGNTNWPSNGCHYDCSVVFGAGYTSTAGFGRSRCRGSGKWNKQNKISFWCHDNRDASVMMIGSGGNDCSGADHGIGITENGAFHGDKNKEYDFGDDVNKQPEKSYSLNLWVR